MKIQIKRYIFSHLLSIGLFSIIVLGGIAIFIFPWLFTTRHWGFVDFQNTGTIGDTINGIAGPFIALASTFIIFLAFWAQIESNHFEIFETHYYELLHLHKENVQEMSISAKGWHQVPGKYPEIESFSIMNRKVFPAMYIEFHYCFILCQNIYDEMKNNLKNNIYNKKSLNETYTDIQLVELAYPFFWAGVGQTSDLLTKKLNNKFNYDLINAIKNKLKNINENYEPYSPPDDVKDRNGNRLSLEKLRYRPFSGHLSRLGHYYRHLFQTVKYIIINKENKVITEDEAENYLKTLRAQLSDYEQIMLYYNALSGYGSAWFKNEYFTEYRMIHNIPLDLATFGCNPKEHEVFKKQYNGQELYTNSKGKSYFEYDEKLDI